MFDMFVCACVRACVRVCLCASNLYGLHPTYSALLVQPHNSVTESIETKP